MTCCCCAGDDRLQPAPDAPRREITAADAPAGCAFTLGHSTRPIGDFIALLQAHRITQLLDVRTVPKSRHNPQFETGALAQSLGGAGIAYARAEGLGGFRRTSAASPNGGWRNASFRGYADYMATPAFQASLADAMALLNHQRVAFMCAEAVPWRCHRSLIADALFVRGHVACEIASATRLQPHRLTPFARVDGLTITYPPEG
ncbi:MAG: DUF488 domain-containing protein [Rubrivivax sp.]|nr:MAG: DUF488 domain-containing protein [Rubrivivax sp.]